MQTTGRNFLTLKGHAAGVRCIAFSPDGRSLVLRSSILLDDVLSKMNICDPVERTELQEFEPIGFSAIHVHPEKPIFSLVRKAKAFAHRSVEVLMARHLVGIEVLDRIVVKASVTKNMITRECKLLSECLWIANHDAGIGSEIIE